MRSIDPYAARLAIYALIGTALFLLFVYYVWPGGR